MIQDRISFPFEDMSLSGIWTSPDQPTAQVVLAHGAGAGMEHPFMNALAEAWAQIGLATLRWQFPYMEKGSKRPDSPRKAIAAWKAAAEFAVEHSPLPCFAGGKSFGGRMASLAAAQGELPAALKGLIFVGFPLHAAGKPGTERAQHLPDIHLPMLFLQGTRDALADLTLLKPLLSPLPKAQLSIFEEADHSFHTRKKSGITPEEVMQKLVVTTETWVEGIVKG